MHRVARGLLAVAALLLVPNHASARDQIRIIGSSTVFPFALAAAERFRATSGMDLPVVESTGTGGGFKLFCAGVGPATPDISLASRRIKPDELEACRRNGVTEIVEGRIGFDGIVLAHSRNAPAYAFERWQIFMALAETVVIDGVATPNPFKRWSEIDPALPDQKIVVVGPPPSSGTRDAFQDLIMHPGCEQAAQEGTCAGLRMREDGHWIDAGEDDTLIVELLLVDPDAIGIFGFSYLDGQSDALVGASIEGVVPSTSSIASRDYPASRPLFFYLKRAHVGAIMGLEQFAQEFVSEAAIAPQGYLYAIGLVPMTAAEREAARSVVSELETLDGTRAR